MPLYRILKPRAKTHSPSPCTNKFHAHAQEIHTCSKTTTTKTLALGTLPRGVLHVLEGIIHIVRTLEKSILYLHERQKLCCSSYHRAPARPAGYTPTMKIRLCKLIKHYDLAIRQANKNSFESRKRLHIHKLFVIKRNG